MTPTQAAQKLHASGLSHRKIAALVGASPSVMFRILHGQQSATYETGKKLVELASIGDFVDYNALANARREK